MKKRRAIAALLLMNSVKTKRRYWVRPIIKNRGRKGEFESLVTELMKEDSEWFYKWIQILFNYLLVSLVREYNWVNFLFG